MTTKTRKGADEDKGTEPIPFPTAKESRKQPMSEEEAPFFDQRERLLLTVANNHVAHQVKSARRCLAGLRLQDLRIDAYDEKSKALKEALGKMEGTKPLPIPEGCREVAIIGLQLLYSKQYRRRHDAETLGSSADLLERYDKELSELRRLADTVRGQLHLEGIVDPPTKDDDDEE